MTDSQNTDPAATFRLDQDAAEAEHKSRDQQSWEANVRSSAAQAFAHEAHGMRQAATADLLNAISSAVAILATVTALHGLKRLVTRR